MPVRGGGRRHSALDNKWPEVRQIVMGYFNVERNPCQNGGRRWRGGPSRVGVWKIGYEIIPSSAPRYWQTRYGRIEVVEQVFRQGTSGPEIRPFTRSAEVVCRGWSEPLQRAIVDFGADAPAARIPQKLKEHCGIEVCASTCWSIVLQHAQPPPDWPCRSFCSSPSSYISRMMSQPPMNSPPT